jgi:hypothetical protein
LRYLCIFVKSNRHPTTIYYFCSLVFLYTSGFVFLTTALTVALFIREANWRASDCETGAEVEHLPLTSTYKMIWEMLKLAPIRKFAVILLTYKVNSELDHQKQKIFSNTHINRLRLPQIRLFL